MAPKASFGRGASLERREHNAQRKGRSYYVRPSFLPLFTGVRGKGFSNTAAIVEFYGSMRATNKEGSGTPLLGLLRRNISSEILSFGTSRKLSECPFSLRARIAILFS